MTKEAIFAIRCDLDKKRQPAQKDQLQALREHVLKLTTQPYDLPFPERLGLSNVVAAFAHGAKGESAELDSQFVYRISSIGDVVRSVTWKNRTNDDTAFDPVFALHAIPGEWLPLANFATGVFQNYRAFSWWSPFDLTSGDLWTAWRRLGVLDDWIMNESLLMRCRRESLSVAIPTTMDGFEGPVFEAMSEQPRAIAGRAIDLSNRPFTAGELEVVVGPIPVDHIDVKPVLVPDFVKHLGTPACDTLDTWVDLESYYRSCE